MKRVLFLPLFQMESGHHRTADALIEAFHKQDPDIQCTKVDFLSYTNQTLEKVISQLYLNWITKWPSAYSWMYTSFFQKDKSFMHSLYETLFVEKMEQLLEEEQPDLILCTHSFSSLLIDKLRSYGIETAPVVNVYTDFFMNGVWGKEHVDMHIVPTSDMKQTLIEGGVDSDSIKVSGILTNDTFKKRKPTKKDAKLHVLVGGGSLGLGDSLQSLVTKKGSSKIDYTILCGHNKELLDHVQALKSPNIKGMSYIAEAEQMNHLYNWADVLITKPGGITMGEAIKKMLPIFVHSVLPGQEEKNMKYLEEEGLVHRLNPNTPIDRQVIAVLKDESAQFLMKKSRHQFVKNIDVSSCSELAGLLTETYLQEHPDEHIRFIDDVFSKLYQTL
ncbi:galactosyldiacylglycerol synthase [Rossellomorea sp. NPDC077527]|uniref:MGDG synthase family glycosyltransferase n=1 Tax=Rossellomorea sp. NPDC077527 TaxID=3364510 RepID=UPI0037C7ABCA